MSSRSFDASTLSSLPTSITVSAALEYASSADSIANLALAIAPVSSLFSIASATWRLAASICFRATSATAFAALSFSSSSARSFANLAFISSSAFRRASATCRSLCPFSSSICLSSSDCFSAAASSFFRSSSRAIPIASFCRFWLDFSASAARFSNTSI